MIKVVKCAGPSSCCQRHSLGPCRSEHFLQGKFGLDVARAELLRRVRPFLFASCIVCIRSFCTESLTFAVSLPEPRKVNLLVWSSGTLDPRTNSDMPLDDSFLFDLNAWEASPSRRWHYPDLVFQEKKARLFTLSLQSFAERFPCTISACLSSPFGASVAYSCERNWLGVMIERRGPTRQGEDIMLQFLQVVSFSGNLSL